MSIRKLKSKRKWNSKSKMSQHRLLEFQGNRSFLLSPSPSSFSFFFFSRFGFFILFSVLTQIPGKQRCKIFGFWYPSSRLDFWVRIHVSLIWSQLRCGIAWIWFGRLPLRRNSTSCFLSHHPLLFPIFFIFIFLVYFLFVFFIFNFFLKK